MMKKWSFTISMLAATCLASEDADQKKAFLQFTADQGKQYTELGEFEKRLGIYNQNKEVVDKLNAAGTQAHFDLGQYGDLTNDEFKEGLGLVVPSDQTTNSPPSANQGGVGALVDYKINWVDLQKMGPVKNQGSCGSCWAFAATSAQEAIQSIKLDKPIVRLSEQEGVDCSVGSYGCNGGWMYDYWKFSEQNGSMRNQEYEYQAQTLACRNQERKNQETGNRIASKADLSLYRHVQGGAEAIAQNLQDGPMTIAVRAGSSCWQFYSGGILTEEDNCALGLDHAVVVVGLDQAADGTNYWLVQNSWGSWWGENGFIKLEAVDGEGISSMNLHVEHIGVRDGYDPDNWKDDEEEPKPDPTDMCDIDEAQNKLGPNRCSYSSECQGDRTCSQWGWCQGQSNCEEKEEEEENEEEEEEQEEDEEVDPEPIVDSCDINEKLNYFGPNQCKTNDECRGERFCNRCGECKGMHNCGRI